MASGVGNAWLLISRFLRASNKMSLHSSGFFSAWRRCQVKKRPQRSFGYVCGDFDLPPCQSKKRSLSMQQFILLEALNMPRDILCGNRLSGDLDTIRKAGIRNFAVLGQRYRAVLPQVLITYELG